MMTKLLAPLLLFLTAAPVFADPVSEFSLPDLQGKQVTLSQYQGKWIVINFWATNCPPCVQEIPELKAFYRRHKDVDAVVLGVNYEDIKRSWLEDFIESVALNYPVLLAEEGKPTVFGAITMLPTTILVSPEGRLMGIHRGAITAQMLDGYIEHHTGQRPHMAGNAPSRGDTP